METLVQGIAYIAMHSQLSLLTACRTPSYLLPSKISMELMRDINKDTIDFIPNYDGEEREPSVLPCRIPNLLVNGTTGIAVGMATNMPPHNIGEVIDAVIAVSKNPDITVLQLMENYIQGPDFPTGGYILGKSAIKKAYETGNGLIVMRAKTEIEEHKGRQRIVAYEIPYQVNKARLVEKIAHLARDKVVEGISDVRDESNREGIRIVIELKRDVQAEVILNQLYKLTSLQTTFGVNNIALVNNEPKTLTLKELIQYYLQHQEEVIRRRTQFELNKAEARAHILEGLKIALDNIDDVIHIIRNSKTSDIAKSTLMERFQLSEKQAQAILEMRLRRLTGLERDKIEEELNEIMQYIEYLNSILADEMKLLGVIKEELREIKSKYNDERRTEIQKVVNEIDIEDLIQEEDVVITLTNSGYIKRISADTYSAQRRGGRGIQAMTTKEDDFVENVLITSTHSDVLFFTNRGRVYKKRAYEIPDAGRTAKGTNIINLIPIEQDERIETVLTVADEIREGYLFMATKKGLVKKTPLSEFKNLRKNGLIAISLREGDELLKVKVTRGDADIVIVSERGNAIKFNEQDVRPMGRTAAGVKSMNLREDDIAVCMDIAVDDEDLLVISENGFGKRTPLVEYKRQNRGGVGLITYKISEKTGKVVGATVCKSEDELMLINTSGVAIRINVSDVSVTSRATMGVRLMRTSDEEKIVAIAKISGRDVEDKDQQLTLTDELDRQENEVVEDNSLDKLVQEAQKQMDEKSNSEE